MYDPALNRRESGIDWSLWAAVLGLMILGAAFIFSAREAAEVSTSRPWWRYTAVNQIIYYIVGIGAVVGLCLVEYRRIARWALVGYWFSILLLVAVFFFGVPRNGAYRWIDLGPIQFQPSEFSKVAFLFAMANFLSRPIDELRSPALFLKALAMAMLPFVMVLKEPDLGSALTFLPVTLAMMFVAGVPRRYLARFIGGGAALVLLVLVDVLYAPEGWRFIKLEDYQKRRLMVYFDLDFAPPQASEAERHKARWDKANASQNVRQALISVGSGGLTGKGWRQGTQHSLGFLPRLGAHNDFIFSVIAEEKGFVGSASVMACYTLILFSGIRIAGQARDRLGKLLAVGVTTLLFTHVVVNIGMNIGLMPVTGIPLPLLSAGGTSVLCSLLAIGILQNVQLYRRHY